MHRCARAGAGDPDAGGARGSVARDHRGYGVALAAARGFDVAEAAGLLEGARPTAVNLGYGVRRVAAAYWAASGKGEGDEAAAAAALAEARALHREDAQASRRMAEYGQALLEELLPGRAYQLLTHCNTGALVSGVRGRLSQWRCGCTGRGGCDGCGWTRRGRCSRGRG